MNLIARLFGKKNNAENYPQREVSIKEFESIKSFWEFITQDSKWYLKYTPYQIKDIEKHISELAPLILNTTNDLRKNLQFSLSDYDSILLWDNLLMRNDSDATSDFTLGDLKFKQFCPNCQTEIKSELMLRYPKAICKNCTKEITSKDGRKVEFFNTGFSGCQGYYASTNQEEEYPSETCYLNHKEYTAEEARFGGIVIQQND